jgi:hypothetical protein
MIDTSEKINSMFLHTRKDYWKGSWYPYWTLLVVTIFGGLFGLDHLWLRSPLSASLKLIVNVCTFGLWYIYDIVQIFKDKELVMKHGLSAPIIGPLGIGAGMFRDGESNPNAPTAKAPWRFLLFMVLLWLPFGGDFLIAGDTNGALLRFITSFVIFFWGYGFVWGLVNTARAYLMPEALFNNGTYRMFPLSWFMDANGPSVLGPVDVPNTTDKCDTGGLSGIFRGIFTSMMSMFTILMTILPESIRIAVNTLFPTVVPAVESIAMATQAAASTAATAAQTTSEIIRVAKDDILPVIEKSVPVIESGLEAATAATGALGDISTIKQGVIEKLESTMKGGGRGSSSSSFGLLDSGIVSDNAVFFILLLLIGGGSVLAFSNAMQTYMQSRKESDKHGNNGTKKDTKDGKVNDDTPPRA